MNKSMKLYNKAINYYNDGNIEKSLDYCEKSISENIKNSSAINLKGLLYYLKGELESAQALWRMNYQVNKDMVSKKYYEDSKSDEEKKALCASAVREIKELKIKDAVEMLKECCDSDFNAVNVSNYLTICYTKLGDYESAQKHIEKVLKIDKYNKIALENRKELIEFGIVKAKRKTGFAAAFLGIIFIAILISCIPRFLGHPPVSQGVSDTKIRESSPAPKISNDVQQDIKKQSEQVMSKPKVEVFPKAETISFIDNKNYEALFDIVTKWQNKDLNLNEKTVIINAKQLLVAEGVQYFYNKGSQILASRDYVNAEKYFLKAYDFDQGSYLSPHIIYMLAYSCRNTGDIQSSTKYYREYLNKYPKGGYEDTVLYDMALIYKGIDTNASKDFASRIVKEHSNSIYNNTTINQILTK